MSRFITTTLALALGVTTSLAHAEPTARETVTTTTPNRALLHSGVVTLSLAYVPSVIVAVESPLAIDNQLFIPVAGPWIDYAKRDCSSCKHETFNKVMLVTDGVFQGIGALNILGAFLFPDTRVVATAKDERERHMERTRSARLQVTPAHLGAGVYGLIARGAF